MSEDDGPMILAWHEAREAEEREWIAALPRAGDRAGIIAALRRTGDDQAQAHVRADELLLLLIDDPEVTEAYDESPKWYS